MIFLVKITKGTMDLRVDCFFPPKYFFKPCTAFKLWTFDNAFLIKNFKMSYNSK